MSDRIFKLSLLALSVALASAPDVYAKEERGLSRQTANQSSALTEQALQQAAQAYENDKRRKELLLALDKVGNPFVPMMLERAYRKKIAIEFNDEAEAVRYRQRFDAQQMVKVLDGLAQTGSANALNWLGNYYRDKEDKQDQARAVEYFERSAGMGNTYAMTVLAYLFEDGIGVDKNEAKAFEWYIKAAEAGDETAMRISADIYWSGQFVPKNEGKAVQWYIKAAGLGEANAMRSLGSLYANGLGGIAKDESKAVEWYRKAAEQGNTDAQVNLGFMYETGKGIAKDETKAVEWYRKAAEQGNVYGQKNLGGMYQNGTGITKDEAKAVEWYRKSAEQNYSVAQYQVGVMYQNGTGITKDAVKAVEWYRKSAEQNYSVAQYQVGVMYQNGTGITKDAVKAVEWYRKSAEQNYSVAQYQVGVMYQNGTGIPKDESKAVEWYRKSAEQNYSIAQYQLGVMYQMGTGITKDETEAAEWYRKSAEQNYSVAQYQLGVMYQNGTGITKDEVKAVEWTRKAAEQGNAAAQTNLGYAYEKGQGGLFKDDAKAVEWYRKAAEQGHVTGQFNLGAMYQNGLGLAKDEVKAVEWYMKSAEAGNANAQRYLGWMYSRGKGVAQDEAKAVEWYRKAAEKGNAAAQTNLGYAYEKGQGGLSKDTKKAVEWYTKAAEAGDDYGMVNLGMMYIYGEGIKKDGKKGLAWIEKAATSGSEHAVKKLTELKEKGSSNGTKFTLGDVVGVVADVGTALVLNTVGVSISGAGIGSEVAKSVDSLLPNANVKIGQSVKKDPDGAARVVLAAYRKQPEDSEQAKFYKTQLEQYLQNNTVQDVALQKEIKAQFAKPPQLSWEIAPDNQTNQENLQLTVNLKDIGTGIGDVHLLVNNVVVDQKSRGLGRMDGTPSEQRTFTLKLPQGTHQVSIEAYNAENLGQPAKLETTITSTYQKPYKPRLHAIVIGIDQYKNSQLKLNYAVSDANAIYASLNKQIGGLYDAGNITLLTTPTQTSKQAIQQAINQVKQNAQLADVFVLYVAGHGISYADTGYYMLTSDVLQTSEDRLKTTSLKGEELQDLIAQVPTQKKLVLLDTCNSGGALSAEKLVASRGLNDQLMIDRMKRKSGATILMASESTEQAREGYKGHGLFTYTVLQAFAGQSDYDKDGYVDSDEIKKYVEDTVPEIAEKHFKSAQTPFASSSGQGLSFKVN